MAHSPRASCNELSALVFHLDDFVCFSHDTCRCPNSAIFFFFLARVNWEHSLARNYDANDVLLTNTLDNAKLSLT